MNEELDRAIKHLANQIKEGVSADDALKYTQAAVNLANAGCALKNRGDAES